MKLTKIITRILFGKPVKGENAYSDRMNKFKTTYPNRKLSEKNWRILHKHPPEK